MPAMPKTLLVFLLSVLFVSLPVEAARSVGSGKVKTHSTYTKTNSQTGKVYAGRTSGTKTPPRNIAARDAGHHMNKHGYGAAVPDKSSTNKDAVRGREQQLIDKNKAAGTSGNKINGISGKNPKRDHYLSEAEKEFGKP